ncbi:MAG: 5'/3'-nucleotidase SurE [Clostridiales Family XIII bacterium]|jgi:5'-nucleotidase|nr:5'/3'-nucleotidase SurE [Clostridiales Family XIII bacterium]
MMNFFVSNDDGIDSPGIKALIKALQGRGDIYVFAPDSQRSAASQSVTIFGSVKSKKVKIENVKMAYSCNGTPVDCVKTGLKMLENRNIKIDMLFSGVNIGRNLGPDIQYSGTVGVAREGLMNGIPSIAFSLTGRFDKKEEYNFDNTKKVIEKLLSIDIKKYLVNFFLNINMPNTKKEVNIKIVPARVNGYHEWFSETEDEKGDIVFEFTGAPIYQMPEVDYYYDDVRAYEEGFISLTPLNFNQNDYEEVEQLVKKFGNL